MSSTEYQQPKEDVCGIILDGHAPPDLLFSIFQAIINCIREINLRLDPNFKVFVYLYGSGHFKKLLPVNPSLKHFRKILKLAHDKKEFLRLAELYNSKGGMHLALSACKATMATQEENSCKRIVLISSNEEPCLPEEVEKCIEISKFLVQSEYLLVPFLVTLNGKAFNVDKFWANLKYLPVDYSLAFQRSELSNSLEPIDVTGLEGKLISMVQAKTVRKPVAFRGQISISNLKIGVSMYSIYSKWTKPTTTRHQWQPHELKKQKSYHEDQDQNQNPDNEDENENLRPQKKLKVGYLYANQPPKPDLLSGLVNIEVLKFVDTQAVPQLGISGKRYFIVGSNLKIRNSKPAFASLHRTLRQKQKVAVCLMHKPSKPHLGLMYAFDPTNSNDNVSPSTECGIYFVPLPFIEDIRVPDLSTVSVSHSHENSTEIERLMQILYYSKGFSPELFENPMYLQFSRAFESVVLHTPFEQPPDNTLPHYARLSSFKNKFNLLIVPTSKSRPQSPVKPKPKPKPLNTSIDWDEECPYSGYSLREILRTDEDDMKEKYDSKTLYWATTKLGLVLATRRRKELYAREIVKAKKEHRIIV